MSHSFADFYPEILRPLLSEDRLPELGPGSPHLAVEPLLRSLTIEQIFPKIADISMAQCCLSGLWLLHDFLDESHTLSQEIHTSSGSYWHALMHRREPDPSNAKYWWRLVGSHPVLERLKSQALREGYTFTNPEDFVDFCERVRGQGGEDEQLAKRMQLLEWLRLFDWCFSQANLHS